MNKITVFAKEFEGKTGKFVKVSIKGKYLPLIEANEEEFYTVKLIGGEITKAGQYDLGYESRKDLWIDSRPENADKNIVRIRVKKVLYIGK